MKSEQLTAWALKELSPEEQARMEALLKEDESVRQQAAQTKEFCDFLTQHLQDPNMALEADQRAELQRNASERTPPVSGAMSPLPAAPQRLPQVWHGASKLRKLYAIAAIFALLAGSAYVWMHEEGKSQVAAKEAAPPSPASAALAAERIRISPPAALAVVATRTPATRPFVAANGLGEKMLQEDTGTIRWKTEKLAPDSGTPVAADAGHVAGTGVIANTPLPLPELKIAPLQGTVAATATTANGSGIVSLPPENGGSFDSIGATLEVGYDSRFYFRGLAFADNTVWSGNSISTPAGTEGDGFAYRELDLSQSLALGGTTPPVGLIQGTAALSPTPNIAPGATAAPVPAAPATAATPPMQVTAGHRMRSLGAFTVAGNAFGDRNAPAAPAAAASATTFSGSIKGGDSANGADGFADSFAAPNPQPADHRSNNESYKPIIENPLLDVMREPLSTFSIDVDTASYANVRRFLNQDSAPPPDAVRLEELINYFPTSAEGPAPDAKEPFAVRVEMASCPWQPQHRLARIAIKGRDLGKDLKPSNLVFLVDVSGSMNEPNKLPLVQKSLRMLTEKLGENDRVTLVTYAGNSGMALPPTNGLKKAEILQAIERLQAGGSTHGSAGIRLAYEQAVASFIKGGVNRVILCTDGDFNVGVSTPEELERLITEKARSGVFLSVLGYGTGNLKDQTMQTLADKGNGNYAYIDSLSEARKVLVEQMGGTLVTIAKDVKIQVEFNPAQVRGYRLIGYEKRLLAKEDFNDDTKDAGEIGAGHSVTALYELVPANLPPGAEPAPLVDKLKYQSAPASRALAAAPAPAAEKPAETPSKEALTVKLRYKEPEGATSKLIEVPVIDEGHDSRAASSEFKFTAAVAGFGLLLRDSSYAGGLTWDQVRQLALEGKGADALGYRGEFLQLIEKARGLKR